MVFYIYNPLTQNPMGLKQKKKCTDAKNNGNLIMKNECSKKQTPDHLITETLIPCQQPTN